MSNKLTIDQSLKPRPPSNGTLVGSVPNMLLHRETTQHATHKKNNAAIHMVACFTASDFVIGWFIEGPEPNVY